MTYPTRTISFPAPPDLTTLQIALTDLPGPYSVEIRQPRQVGLEWVEWIDADSVQDIYDFIQDECAAHAPITLEVEHIRPAGDEDSWGDSLAELEEAATGLRPCRSSIYDDQA